MSECSVLENLKVRCPLFRCSVSPTQSGSLDYPSEFEHSPRGAFVQKRCLTRRHLSWILMYWWGELARWFLRLTSVYHKAGHFADVCGDYNDFSEVNIPSSNSCPPVPFISCPLFCSGLSSIPGILFHLSDWSALWFFCSQADFPPNCLRCPRCPWEGRSPVVGQGVDYTTPASAGWLFFSSLVHTG